MESLFSWLFASPEKESAQRDGGKSGCHQQYDRPEILLRAGLLGPQLESSSGSQLHRSRVWGGLGAHCLPHAGR